MIKTTLGTFFVGDILEITKVVKDFVSINGKYRMTEKIYKHKGKLGFREKYHTYPHPSHTYDNLLLETAEGEISVHLRNGLIHIKKVSE